MAREQEWWTVANLKLKAYSASTGSEDRGGARQDKGGDEESQGLERESDTTVSGVIKKRKKEIILDKMEFIKFKRKVNYI